MAKGNSVENSPPVKAERAPDKKAQKFSVEKLAENCRKLFNVSSCEFAGATYGATGEFSIEEMKERIEKWRKARR